ncbi:MAG: hypothetical protein F6K41_29745 [Symploca sp. SIO3E6]|nr:hypothetical protein [Caldora sp. SIO3E6]
MKPYKLLTDLKETRGRGDTETRRHGDAERRIFMHSSEKKFFHRDCLLPSAFRAIGLC